MFKTIFPPAVFVAFLLSFCAQSETKTTPPNPCPNGHISITYDDGPNQEWTPRVLDYLKSRSAQGMFFIVGNNAQENPDLLKRLYNEYHQIGNHAWRHERLTELSDEEIETTLRRTNEIIRSIGYEPKLVRPPFRSSDSRVRAVLKKVGLVEHFISIDTQDWEVPGADMIVARVVSGLHDGGRVALHDGWAHNDREGTVEATPRIIDEARSRGYCIGALDDSANVIPATGRNITFGDEDSGVPNYARDGAAFLDWVWAQVAFDSHEQFVSVVEELARAWEEEGLFTRDERQAVINAATDSGIGGLVDF